MKRFIAVVLSLIMLLSMSVLSFALDDAENEMKENPNRVGEPGNSAAYTEMVLYTDANGKVLRDMDGNVIKGKIRDNVFARFYQLMAGVPVDWSKFDYASYEVFMDELSNVTFGKQKMGALDGTAVMSDNAEVVIFETPGKFHAVTTGKANLTHFDFFDNELGTSEATVRQLANGSLFIMNKCEHCGEDQGKEFHLMACGHYSCEVGEIGHGAGACGIPGHMNCDGDVHDICSNCLKPMCSGGMHGVGVCEHVHRWQFAGGWFTPSHNYWVNRYYCEGCNTFTFAPVEVPQKAEN